VGVTVGIGGDVADEDVGQLLGAAERDAVAGGDLVGDDGEPVGHDPAHEVGGEEAVLGAQHETGGHVGPRRQGPPAAPGGGGLVAALALGLFGEGAGDVVVEGDEGVVVAGPAAVPAGLLLDGLLKAHRRVPVTGRLPRRRDHPGHEHQHVDREPIGHQGRGEPAEGVTDDDQVAPVADGLDDGVGVLGKSGGIVVAGQVGSDHVVAPPAQLLLHEVPGPADVAAAVDQHEGCHAPHRPWSTGADARSTSRALDETSQPLDLLLSV